MTYREEFIHFMVRSGVLTFGDFVTKSGRKTPYFVNTGNYKTGAQAAKLGDYYAACIQENMPEGITALFGPAYKGIPLAVTAAASLYRNYDRDLPYCFNRKEAKDHGEGGIFVGYVPQEGEQVVVIEDVITAGTAIRESMHLLSRLSGVQVAAAFIMVDRREKGRSEKSAMREIEEEFGLRVYSVVDVYDILEYLREDPANAENVARIENYLKVNGAKV